jgi:hypothetical protein
MIWYDMILYQKINDISNVWDYVCNINYPHDILRTICPEVQLHCLNMYAKQSSTAPKMSGRPNVNQTFPEKAQVMY